MNDHRSKVLAGDAVGSGVATNVDSIELEIGGSSLNELGAVLFRSRQVASGHRLAMSIPVAVVGGVIETPPRFVLPLAGPLGAILMGAIAVLSLS